MKIQNIKRTLNVKFNEAKLFCHEHKDEIIAGAIVVGGCITGIVVYKNRKQVNEFISTIDLNKIKADDITVEPIAKMIQPDISDSVFDSLVNNRTGEMMTARDIGYAIGKSAQQVNKKLIEKGFLEYDQGGHLCATNLGRKFGVLKDKMTSSGHSFSNYEWDSSLLNLFMSPDNYEKYNAIRNTALNNPNYVLRQEQLSSAIRDFTKPIEQIKEEFPEFFDTYDVYE